jgi:hypothetical protein
MKNKRCKIFLSGILALVLVFGFVAVGCATSTDSGGGDGGNMATKFEGSWINNSTQSEYVFINNTWRLNRSGRNNISGTFTFADEPAQIQFTTTSGGSGGFSYLYEFKDDGTILSLSGNNGPGNSTGDFTKQP